MAKGDCKTIIDNVEVQVQNDINTFENDTISAVASLIGYPSKSAIKNAQARLNNAVTRKEKKIATKQLKSEQLKHEEHNKLFDILSSQILSSGQALNFDMNPIDAIDAWKVYFSKRQLGDVNPTTVMQSQRLFKVMVTKVTEIDKKRNKLIESGKLNNREIALFPPEVISIRADKFGIMMKTIRKGLRLSDNEISSYEGYANQIRNALEKYKNNLMDNPKIQSMLNLNNASAWGIEGFITTIDSPNPSERVILSGEDVQDGVPVYLVKYYNEDGSINNDAVFTLNKAHLNATASEVKKQMIGFYVGDFVNEVMDGRVRYVNFGTTPPESEVFEGRVIINESKERLEFDKKYKKRLSFLLEEMKEDYEYGETTDDKRSTPNVHFVRGKRGTKYAGYQYRYALLKDTEVGGRETYTAILLSREKYNNKDPLERTNFMDEGYDISEWENIDMNEGWYRAQEEKYYGRLRDPESKEMLSGSSRKAWHKFQYVKKQPPQELIEEMTTGEATTEIGYNNFWRALGEMRTIYQGIGNAVQNFEKLNREKLDTLKTRVESRMKKLGMSSTEMEEFMDKIFSIGGMRSKVNYNAPTKEGEDGSISTPDSFFSLKKDNYFPHIFKKRDLLQMIENSIDRIKENISESFPTKEDEIGENKEEFKTLNEGLQHLLDMRSRLVGRTPDDDAEVMTRMVAAQANPYLKHITSWTDATYMRTDSDVHADYLKNIFASLHRNDLMADTVDAVDKLMQMEKQKLVPQGVVDYLVNRIKMSVGDTDTRSTSFVTGKQSGYGNMATKLNNLPSLIRGGTKFTSQSAEKLVKWINSFPSMRFLGSMSAAGNLTQIMNQIIANGFGTFSEAQKLLSGEYTKRKWESIVNGTGVLNILSMFNDIMLQGGDVEWNDYAFAPIIGLPGKNMRDFARLISKGRDNFILNGDKDIDKFLMNLQARTKGIARDNIDELIELSKQKKEILNKKRGQFFDAFAAEENDNSEAIIMSRFKQLIGEVSDQKIRQMVTWKLSFHFDPFKSGFTFTGTEELLRKLTAVMALLDAEKRGSLGGDINIDGSNGDLSIFKTDNARRIARDAVYNTQFGMSPQYVGEGFNGLGRSIYQYKTYALQQMEHDMSVWKKFSEGGYSKSDNIGRLISAAKDAIVRHREGKSYDPSDPNLDQEAIAVLRLVFSRGIASVIASTISVITLGGWLMKKFGHQSFSLLRSFENPALGIAMRTAMWATLATMGSDDDESDDALSEVINDFSFLFLPVFIGMLGRDAYSGVEWWGED